MHQDQAAPHVEPPSALAHAGAAALRPASTLAYTGAVAISLGGAFAFVAVFLLRGGLGDSGVAIATLYLLATTPVWLSVWALSTFGGSPILNALAVMGGVMLGTLLPALGLITGAGGLIPTAVILLLALWGARQALPAVWNARGGLAAMAAVSGGLTILLTAPMRLYMHEALLLGTANSDNYLHAATMQMLTHYGRIAIGADGLGYQNYHWLFHILVVGAAKIARADVTLVYGYWTGLVLKLQLAWAIFMAGLLLYPPDSERGFGWRQAYAWLAMLLAGGFEMESYMQGVALFAVWLPLLLALMRIEPSTAPLPVAGFVALVFAAFVCAEGKASAGFYCAIGLFLLAWQYRARRSVVVFLLISLGGLAFFATSLLIPKAAVLGNVHLRILATSYMIYFDRGILLHYLLPSLIALVFVWRPHGAVRVNPRSWVLEVPVEPSLARNIAVLPTWLAKGGGVLKTLRWFTLVDERAQLLMLSLLGTLFLLFTMPIGDSLWDFSVILFMLSLLLMPAAVGETLNARFTDQFVKYLLAAALAVESVWACTQFILSPVASLPQTMVDLYRSATGIAADQSTGAAKDILLSLKTTHEPLARLHSLIEATPVARLKQTLEHEAQLADGHLVVQLTPAATELWHFFEKNDAAKWCLYPHLLVPAATGIVEIRSIPPAQLQNCSVPGTGWYGYGAHQDLHRTSNFTPLQLCTMGRTLYARRVYLLESLSNLSRNKVVDCSSY